MELTDSGLSSYLFILKVGHVVIASILKKYKTLFWGNALDMRSNCFKAYYGSLLHFHHICLQTYFVILLPTAFVVHLKFPVAPQCSGAGPLLKGTSPRPLEKILPRWKCVNTDFMRNRCFRACYRCKIRTPLRKHFIPLMSQAGYGPVLEALNLKKACKVILVAVH